MSVHEPAHHAPKTLVEGALCFTCALGALALAAVVIQWAMGLVA